MKECKVNILGTEYTVKVCEYNDGGGECNYVDKTIIVNEDHDKQMLKYAINHEIIHAFMFESGLGPNSDWGQNEECVDWIAMQVDKITNALLNVHLDIIGN